ncbi:MAG TPA: biotin--[acetyl-CoA-carboxylase] ligase [Candidatus Eisenbacteria bacterium]|nr:biotin--[acetyl-CoA-carboxylase] ligase [Candidatus Eisenbacteria bacterium]
MTTRFLDVPLERHPSLASTNDEALRRAEEGAPSGLVVFAETQTAGRGRQGRSWNDVAGASLAFSVVLRPTIPLPQYPLLAIAMACAVAEACEELSGTAFAVKWPNDVLLEGRKVCGVLAESRVPSAVRVPGGAGLALVVGAGVNVNHHEDDFSAELRARAASLRMAAGGRTFNVVHVLDAILARFERYVALASAADAAPLWNAVLRRLPAPGTRASIRSGDRLFQGVIQGFTETGAIRLLEDGRAEAVTLSAGEMELAGETA